MKIIHLNYLKSSKNNIGVINQLKDEIFFADKLNLNWDVKVVSGEIDAPEKFLIKISKYLKIRILNQLYFNYILIKKSFDYDVMLVRYDPLNIFILFFLLKKTYKLFFVLHTDEQRSFNLNFKINLDWHLERLIYLC